MVKYNIARCMSTQHPDNVRAPFFSDNVVIEGDDEIKEAYYCFSNLDMKEQLWDCEGKEVDNFVIKKILTRYPVFFSNNRLGRDRFMLLRVPNPEVEKNEAKILFEVLESIPRSFDISNAIYKDDVAPLFEVSVPMTSSAKTLIRISEYYKRFVSGKQDVSLIDGDVKISEWIGRFYPDKIRLMPLFETKEAMLDADKITKEYIDSQKPEGYQRVWLARSDPALNYGNLAATLIIKVSLQRLHKLEQKLSLDIPVMIGVGSAPFRGNVNPTNVANILQEFPSIQTYTIQSAFKYDYEENVVKKAIDYLNNSKRCEPTLVDEEVLIKIIEKTSTQYQKEIKVMAPLINKMSLYIPKRRKRKLHIGLFGYSRKTADVHLPRAITFTAALYSLGLPPELLGLGALNKDDVKIIRSIYPNFDNDLADCLKYLNTDNLKYFPKEALQSVEFALGLIDYNVDKEHKELTENIMKNLMKLETETIAEEVVKAGHIRKFLG